jgi:hypothetical protein
LAEAQAEPRRPQFLERAAHVAGWLGVIGLAAALLHPGCYVLPRARVLLGIGALALWAIAGAGRQRVLVSLPARLAMTGALVVLFEATRGASFASLEIGGMAVAPSWGLIPLAVLVAAWLVALAQGRGSLGAASPFPLAVLLAAGLVVLVAIVCFPLIGFRYSLGPEALAGVVVTVVQFAGLALAGLDTFGREMPRWMLIVLGIVLAAKAVLASLAGE